MSYDDDNDGGFGARHFDQLTTAGLFSASNTLSDANQRIRDFEENNKGDIRDTCLRDAQAFEAGVGNVLGDYYRDGEMVHMSTHMSNFAFIGSLLVMSLKVMERYSLAMGNLRSIASELENLINITTHQVDAEGHPDFNLFSGMIDNGAKDDLVEMVSEALSEAIDPNVLKTIVEQAADMALLSTESPQHHLQRELIGLVNGNLMERVAAKLMADMERDAKAATATPSNFGNPFGLKGQERRERPSFLRVVDGKKE